MMSTNGEVESAAEAAETPSVDDLRREHYERIREKEKEVGELELTMRMRHEEYKDAKKIFEGGQSELRALIRRDPSQRLLFSDTEAADPEAWRAVTLAELGIEGKVAELLTEAKLTTLGAIADWTKEFELTDVSGVGPAKAEQIQEKLDLYWQQNPPVDASDDEVEFERDQQAFKDEVEATLVKAGVPFQKNVSITVGK